MNDIASLQELLVPLFPGLMGVRLLTLAPDRVVAEMDVRPDLCTAGGVLHGGAYMAFADTLGAVGTIANLAAGKRTTTTDSSTKFIAGARVNTTVTGESVALHRGRTTMVWQTFIRNADGKLCAVVSQTQLVLDAPA
jgi:1,4-dihydroxy-2-naphthoyl-CoA hydrolase